MNPDVLKWARESAGLSEEEAATQLGLKAARGQTAAERLRALEAGQPVTRPTLLKMAKVYRRPLVTFYLNAPPPKPFGGEDFRNLPDRDPRTEPLVDALVRDIRARQSIVRSILEDEEEAQPLPFVGSMSVQDGVGPVLASLRQTLRFDLADFRAQASPESAFALLREKTEAVGLFTLLIGDLGSHHTALEVEAFRGFALADPIAPFVVINDRDARAAWSFTLIHEVTHIWLGASGVSGAYSDTRIERFCNDVASGFLLPDHELKLVRVDEGTPLEQAERVVSDFAEERHLSRSMVAYRLFRSGSISDARWRDLRTTFHARWVQMRAAQKERERDRDAGGPSYYVVRRHRLGSALLRVVARNMREGALTPTEAGKVLGVRARNVEPLLSGAALPVG